MAASSSVWWPGVELGRDSAKQFSGPASRLLCRQGGGFQCALQDVVRFFRHSLFVQARGTRKLCPETCRLFKSLCLLGFMQTLLATVLMQSKTCADNDKRHDQNGQHNDAGSRSGGVRTASRAAGCGLSCDRCNWWLWSWCYRDIFVFRVAIGAAHNAWQCGLAEVRGPTSCALS